MSPSPNIDKPSRRSVLKMGIAGAATGVLTVFGVAVGFRPTAANAANKPICDVPAVHLSGCDCHAGLSSCGCIGGCSSTYSECKFGPRSVDICTISAPSGDQSAKAAAYCNPITDEGICCGTFC